MTSLTLRAVPLGGVPWNELDGCADRNVFQTRAWLQFLARTQNAKPVVAALRDGRETVGWFSGMLQKRFGVPLLGSPFPGWNTSYLGFNLKPGVDRRAAFEALPEFAFGEMGCAHLEVRCRNVGFHELDGLGFERGHTFRTYTVDLRPNEDEMFERMLRECRKSVRRSEKEGVVIEEAKDDAFADDYFAQLLDVFEKQGLEPHYGIERVRILMEEVLPTGNLLLLRARVGDECIATGIFPVFDKVAYCWGSASFRSGQAMRPNEPLMWHAMRALRELGAEELDLGGEGSYKEKYGPTRTAVPLYMRSRWRAVSVARNYAERIIRKRLGRPPVPPVYIPESAEFDV